MTRAQRKHLARITAMARLLNHQVPELNDEQACLRQLTRAGYDPSLAWRSLDEAQTLARDLRSHAADTLVIDLFFEGEEAA
jgi:hypothetical protein